VIPGLRLISISLILTLHDVKNSCFQVHGYMEKLCPTNRKSFSLIEESIFNVSLDDYFLPPQVVHQASKFKEEEEK
jgi:hypothetical protein